MKIFPAVGVLLCVTFLIAGCSDKVDYGPTGTVSGRLTLEGKSAKKGTQVVFMHPEKGYASFGSTDENGNFKITSWNEGNLPVGLYQVMVQPPAGVDPDSVSAEQLLNDPQMSVPMPAEFPFKYRQTSTSGLSYEVKEGPNSFEIDLKK